MIKRILCLCVLALGAATLAVAASSEMSSHPGYFKLEDLGLIDADMAEVDINLSGSLLAMVSGATKNQDPALSEMMSELKGIRVLTGEPITGDFATLAHRIDEAEKNLAARGWQRIVRVKEDDERVFIYVMEDGNAIQGITILALEDGDEVVLLNIVGTMNPEQMGRMMSGIDGVSGVNLNVDFD